MEPRARIFGTAMLFEAGLGFLGVTLAWLAGISLTSQLVVTQAALVRGVGATIPLLAMLAVITLTNWPPFVGLRQQIEAVVGDLFVASRPLELALICLAAGVGEELLFRGALQPWLAQWTPPVVAVAVVSLLFGLAHALSTTYFVTATAIGCYFGWLTMAYNDLVAPILAHGLYDFVALTYVQHRVRNRPQRD